MAHLNTKTPVEIKVKDLHILKIYAAKAYTESEINEVVVNEHDNKQKIMLLTINK